MPRIQVIKNVTAVASGTATPFEKSTNFGFWPDEAIVKQISYSGPDAYLAGVYFVWCSLINDYIGSFTVNNLGTTVTPKTRIHFPRNQPMPINVTFRVDSLNGAGTEMAPATLTGDISVSIDFIKYE